MSSDSYLPPSPAVPAAAAALGLLATADECLASKGAELDRRLEYFARRLQRGKLESGEFRDGRLHGAPVKASTTPEAHAFADGIEAMMPRVRITELLHEMNRATTFASAFTSLRTGERCDDENALLAAILADATNLGLGRMAAASHRGNPRQADLDRRCLYPPRDLQGSAGADHRRACAAWHLLVTERSRDGNPTCAKFFSLPS